jgi:serine/threonine protein kinase
LTGRVDLNPETIVNTEPGHVKLTDFGSCRPVTEEAKQRMICFCVKNLLKDLRVIVTESCNSKEEGKCI